MHFCRGATGSNFSRSISSSEYENNIARVACQRHNRTRENIVETTQLVNHCISCKLAPLSLEVRRTSTHLCVDNFLRRYHLTIGLRDQDDTNTFMHQKRQKQADEKRIYTVKCHSKTIEHPKSSRKVQNSP